MPPESPFETHYREYDAWFDANRNLFCSELLAIRAVLPTQGAASALWVEIGVGSGRFAAALGIGVGVEPAESMAALARARGIRVLKGVAEDLPLATGSVDVAFLITVTCFVEDMDRAFAEVARVLTPRGSAVVAFIPSDSELGELYADAKGDPFFAVATLRSRNAVRAALERAGLTVQAAVSTLRCVPLEEDALRELPSEDWRAGSFVVLRVVNAGEAPPLRRTGKVAHS